HAATTRDHVPLWCHGQPDRRPDRRRLLVRGSRLPGRAVYADPALRHPAAARLLASRAQVRSGGPCDEAGRMKILISAEVEGATGVTWPSAVRPGTEQWQRCRRMFNSEVNAAVAGFCAGGAEQVLVNEAHATMRNLLLEELDERAVLLTGRHKELSMLEGIQDPDVGAVAFIGYHAAAGRRGRAGAYLLGQFDYQRPGQRQARQ